MLAVLEMHESVVLALRPKQKQTAGGSWPIWYPKEFQAEGILEALGGLEMKGQRILIPRAKVARELLAGTIGGRWGHMFGLSMPIKRCHRKRNESRSPDRFRNQDIQYLTFTSSSTVKNFCQLFTDRQEMHKLTQDAIVACIGPITAQTVQSEGLSVDIVAAENTVPALVDAIVAHANQTHTKVVLYNENCNDGR